MLDFIESVRDEPPRKNDRLLFKKEMSDFWLFNFDNNEYSLPDLQGTLPHRNDAISQDMHGYIRTYSRNNPPYLPKTFDEMKCWLDLLNH